MIKAVSISFLVFLFIFLFIENSSGQNFELPTEEILKKYLRISRAELIKKCMDKDKCLASKVVDHEVGKKSAGEKLIDYIVIEARKLTSVSENDWNSLTQKHCKTSSFFLVMMETTIDNAKRCLAPHEVPGPDVIKKAFVEYVEIYCTRVKDLAKRKFHGRENGDY